MKKLRTLEIELTNAAVNNGLIVVNLDQHTSLRLHERMTIRGAKSECKTDLSGSMVRFRDRTKLWAMLKALGARAGDAMVLLETAPNVFSLAVRPKPVVEYDLQKLVANLRRTLPKKYIRLLADKLRE